MQTQTVRTPPVSIEVQEYEKFKTIAQSRDASISKAIRQLITLYNEQEGDLSVKPKRKKKKIPFEEYMFKSGKNTKFDSQNYKEHLYGKYADR